jgi:hypothetical protein
MLKSQAKRLKKGDKVIFRKPGESQHDDDGEVVNKRYNTVWIKWSKQAPDVTTHYAESMEYVFTPEGYARDQEAQRVGEKVKEENRKFPPPVRW